MKRALDPEDIVRYEEEGPRVVLLDQRRLPDEEVELECRSVAEVVAAIRELAIRGAPAIGVAAAYALALAAERREDIDEAAYAKAARRLTVPAIPNLFHWFRRYVMVDLARIKKEITELKATKAERDFFLLCFASIIRAASNADPVPVSGLEVTSHMKEREKEGRVVNVTRPKHNFTERDARRILKTPWT